MQEFSVPVLYESTPCNEQVVRRLAFSTMRCSFSSACLLHLDLYSAKRQHCQVQPSVFFMKILVSIGTASDNKNTAHSQ